MLKLFLHNVWTKSRAFHKAGPDIEKASDPVFVFIWRTTNIFEFVERRNLGISAEQESQPDMQVIAHIIKSEAWHEANVI